MSVSLKCVLLIDDDAFTNFINKILIAEENSNVFIVRKETVISGLKYLTDSAQMSDGSIFPDLIFLDVDMPECNGWDFLKSFDGIKDNLPKKPIIYMLTAFAEQQEIFDLSNAHALAGLCKKPLTNKLFKTIVKKHFISAKK